MVILLGILLKGQTVKGITIFSVSIVSSLLWSIFVFIQERCRLGSQELTYCIGSKLMKRSPTYPVNKIDIDIIERCHNWCHNSYKKTFSHSFEPTTIVKSVISQLFRYFTGYCIINFLANSLHLILLCYSIYYIISNRKYLLLN